VSYITLTTDFGGSPGVMKGVIWRIAPRVQIADLSHTIRPYDVRQAALLLARQVEYFPENTIHVAVVDPGVGTARRPLAAQIGPQRVVGPDNGIFTPLFQRAAQAGWPVRMVHTDRTAYWLPQVSAIFHGRDVFAPVAAHWAAGVPLEALGEVIEDPVQLALPRPQPTAQGVTGEVTLIFQHFGNLITNIQRADLEDWSQVRIRLCEVEIEGLVQTFGDRPPGTLIALFGSSGHLMIAVVNGRATDYLQPSIGDQVEVLRKT
jgi:S-adenosylmethionine hydrolase